MADNLNIPSTHLASTTSARVVSDLTHPRSGSTMILSITYTVIKQHPHTESLEADNTTVDTTGPIVTTLSTPHQPATTPRPVVLISSPIDRTADPPPIPVVIKQHPHTESLEADNTTVDTTGPIVTTLSTPHQPATTPRPVVLISSPIDRTADPPPIPVVSTIEAF
ncbi:uncharacterized protein LOC131597168 [Vicia villosa]|uniref:uncharacterized protein LOC131597168 n=1 Tax=Vicia villosa TaxID=3911 RepID=UPI00273BA70A|nr:uncharacterized protein LOC131597168 [Vicia villosa]